MIEQTTFTTLKRSEIKSLFTDCIKETILSLELLKPQNQIEPKQILSRQETADMLNISLPTLHSYTQKGLIKASRLGCSVRYRLEDVYSSLSLINVGG